MQNKLVQKNIKYQILNNDPTCMDGSHLFQGLWLLGSMDAFLLWLLPPHLEEMD